MPALSAIQVRGINLSGCHRIEGSGAWTTGGCIARLNSTTGEVGGTLSQGNHGHPNLHNNNSVIFGESSFVRATDSVPVIYGDVLNPDPAEIWKQK